MDELIIELTGRGRDGVQRFRFVGDTVRVGRAYDNDVILADPFVAPYQARLERQAEGGWVLIDAGALNPARDARERPLDDPTPIGSGTILWLGSTQLRLVAPDHPIEPTRALGRTNGLAQRLDGVTVALPLVLLAWLGQGLVDYLGHFHGDARFARHAMVGLTGVILALVWSSNWALVGRISGHRRARFWAHLAVASGAVIVLLALSWVNDYVAFWSNSALAADAVELGGIGLVAVAVVFLAVVVTMGTRIPVAAGWSAAVGAGVVALAVLIKVAAQPDFRPTPRYVEVLKPPVPFGVPRAAGNDVAATADAVLDALPKVDTADGDKQGPAPGDGPGPADANTQQ